MHKIFAIVVLGMTSALCIGSDAQAQPSPCNVPVFRGATLPQGGVAEMQVVNNGRPCGIRNFGHYPDTASLAQSGSITTQPKNGVARFEPPRALYTPNPGFVGDDYFEYQASAKGPQDHPVSLRVKVKVSVAAP
ncbi:MAG: hypothetical protein EOP76_14485 [Variovorax sp.]|nr:MAG: hypothetical protein EOP76_14485 [Variovorax sp.]